MVALTAPKQVRRLILAGTSASAPSNPNDKIPGVIWPREESPEEPMRLLSISTNQGEDKRAIEYSFFPDDDSGRSAFASYWSRLETRTAEPPMLHLLDKNVGGARQLKALDHFFSLPGNPNNSFDRLGELKMPVLVANGDNDVLFPSSRSWELMARIADARLIIYPQSGHGFLWQFAEEFAAHINIFLPLK